MKISIILPSYKPKSYLWECLDSINQQTFPKNDFEVVLVLNGCNEPYKSNISTYIKKKLNDLNINFIQTDIGGVSNARNTGIENASGEYITFIDDDDYISPTYLKEMYCIAIQGELPLTNMVAFEDISNVVKDCYISKIYTNLQNKSIQSIMQVRSYFSIPVCKLIRKEIIADNRFNPKYKNGEDSLFMFLISNKIKKMKFTSNQSVYYRRYRDGSATSQQSKKGSLKNNINMIKEYSIIYFKNPFSYNFFFYLSRIIAEIISMMKKIVKK